MGFQLLLFPFILIGTTREHASLPQGYSQRDLPHASVAQLGMNYLASGRDCSCTISLPLALSSFVIEIVLFFSSQRSTRVRR